MTEIHRTGNRFRVGAYLCGVAVVLVSMLLVAACAQGGTPGASSPKAGGVIKVGLIHSGTGLISEMGKFFKRGTQFAVDQANEAGGINGQRIEIVAYDDESKPDQAATFAKKLAMEDGVVAIVGPASATTHVGVAPIAQDLKIPVVASNGAFPPSIKPEQREWNFSSWSDGEYNGPALMMYLKGKGLKKIAIMRTADPSGEGTAQTIRRIADKLGMEVVAEAAQPVTDKDMTPSLVKLKAANPEILLQFGSGTFGTTVMNNTVQVGMDLPIMHLGGNLVPASLAGLDPKVGKNFLASQGKAMDIAGLKDSDPTKAKLAKLAQAFKAKYNEDPNYIEAVAYDAMLPVLEAIKAVGADRAKIRDHIEKSQDGLVGLTGFAWHRSPTEHVGGVMTDRTVVNFANGRFSTIAYVSDVIDDLKSKGGAVILDPYAK